MRKTAATLTAALLLGLLLPAIPAVAASNVDATQSIGGGIPTSVPSASIASTNKAYLAKAAKSLGGADAAAGKLKDGTLWRSYSDGIVVYSTKRKALTVRTPIVKAWADTGWENGKFGYPIAEQYKTGKDTRKKFSGGVLGVRSNGTSYWIPNPPKLTDFKLTGAGWGHGVGMSQYGARAMAEEGKNATQILQYYYNPAKVTSAKDAASADIRVQVLKAPTSSITVASGRMRVKDPTAKKTYVAPAGSTITLSKSKNQLSYVLKNPKGFDAIARDLNKDGKPDVNPVAQANKVTGKLRIEWEGTRAWPSKKTATLSIPKANAESTIPGTYKHGYFEAGILDNQVNLVTSLRMNDEYLYGLAEVPSSWPTAVLQAQAIAGRTYAKRKMTSVRSACDCNVTDEVQDQKFTGYAKENEQAGYGPKWKKAVDATVSRNASGLPISGRVVTYNGRLAETLYSSSTGGATRNSEDVWGGAALPYLRSRPDSWSLNAKANNPYKSWSQNISQKKMAQVFGLSDVVSVTFTKAKDLTITSATAKSSKGISRKLTGNQFRGSTSGVGAMSAWITKVSRIVPSAKATTINPNNFCNVRVKAGASLPKAISSAREGAVICLATGTHRPSNLVLKSRQTLLGVSSSKTKLDGSISVSTKKSSKIYKISSSRIPAKAPKKLSCTSSSQCNSEQILFANGKRLNRVTSKAKVKAGSYWIDHKGRAIYTGKASSSRYKYTMATKARAVKAGTWSRVGKLSVSAYANPSNTGAVWLSGAHSGIFSARVTDNHGIGVQSNGAATQVLSSVIRANGQLGLSASGGKNTVVQGSEISANGWAGYRAGTFTGGIAAANKATVKVSGSKILDNRSSNSRGVRTTSGTRVTVSSSTVRGNK